MDSPIEVLERALSKLPGLGRRSAERAALALVRYPENLLDPLLRALAVARESVECCEECGGFTTIDANPCKMCSDPLRNHSQLCVVEEPSDIIAMEKAGVYKGIYHSLNGRISASRCTGPMELRLDELLMRISSSGIKEVILATGMDMEGEATAQLITLKIKELNTSTIITRLAFGIPVGSAIAYSDAETISRALAGRR